jgi:hypothetical protein
MWPSHVNRSSGRGLRLQSGSLQPPVREAHSPSPLQCPRRWETVSDRPRTQATSAGLGLQSQGPYLGRQSKGGFRLRIPQIDGCQTPIQSGLSPVVQKCYGGSHLGPRPTDP